MNHDKSLLVDAIKNYDRYTKNQRAILSILVQTSDKGISEVSTSFLAKKVGISRTAVYKSLNKFIEEGDIVISNDSKNRTYILNDSAMYKIIELEKNKKHIK